MANKISPGPILPTLPLDQQVATLATEYATLQKRVAALEPQVTALNQHIHEELGPIERAHVVAFEGPLRVFKYSWDHFPANSKFWDDIIKLWQPIVIPPGPTPFVTGPPAQAGDPSLKRPT